MILYGQVLSQFLGIQSEENDRYTSADTLTIRHRAGRQPGMGIESKPDHLSRDFETRSRASSAEIKGSRSASTLRSAVQEPVNEDRDLKQRLEKAENSLEKLSTQTK